MGLHLKGNKNHVKGGTAMTVGQKALVLVVAGTLIPIAVPVIYFPTTTATAVGAGLLVAATIVLRNTPPDEKPLLLRDQFPILTRTPPIGEISNYPLPALDRAMLAGIVTAAVIVLLAYVGGTFRQLTFLDRWDANPERNFAFTLFSATCTLLAAHFFILPKLEAWIRVQRSRSLDTRLRRLRPALDTAASYLSRLHVIQNDIDVLRRDLGLPSCRNFVTETGSIIGSCRLAAPELSVITKAIITLLSEAQKERHNLESTTACYMTATARLSELRRFIDSIHAPALSEELHNLSEALSSDELKGLARGRSWDNFFEVISLLTADIDALTGKARRLANKQQNKSAVDDETLNVAWAYRVLKVSSSATNADIKKAFRALCVRWHPDAGRVRDDTKIKDITHAYHVLKKAKHFA